MTTRVEFTFHICGNIPLTVTAAVHDDGEVDDIEVMWGDEVADIEHLGERIAGNWVPLLDTLAAQAREEAASRRDRSDDLREAYAEMQADARREERLDMLAEVRRFAGFGR